MGKTLNRLATDRVLEAGSAARMLGLSATRVLHLSNLGRLPVAFRSAAGRRFYFESDILREVEKRRARDAAREVGVV